MAWRWTGIAVALLCAPLGVAQAQEAQPERVGPALNWTRQPGAESCIASVELAARIEARVKKPIFVPAPAAIVAVEGYVAPKPEGGFRATIAMSDGQGLLYGSRELETAGACGELDDGLVFVIAVTLRPEAGSVTGIELPENVANALDALFGSEPTEPDPAAFPSEAQATSATPPPNSEPASSAATAPPPAPQPEPPTRAFIEALGALRIGLQPNMAFGGGGGLRVRIAGFGSLSLHGALFAKTTEDIDDVGEPSADFTTRTVSLGYCTPALFESSSLGVEACAAGRAGVVSAVGRDFATKSYEKDSGFIALGLSARLTVALNENVVLALAAGPELHLLRPVFEYEPQLRPFEDTVPAADLYKAGPIGGAAELSVAFALF